MLIAALYCILAVLSTMVRAGMDARPSALVYRGPGASPGCPESVAQLLETSPWNFNVSFAGPEEDIDVDANSLASVQVCAFPGGPDLGEIWEHVKGYKQPLQDFVSAGGHYLGFCLGAYLAGHSTGFGLVPKSTNVSSECEQPDSQVSTDEDAVIQVNWTFVSGKMENNRWLYFQEGAFMTHVDEGQGKILARYSKSGDIAASVTSYGNGRVGLVGPHPEADESWYIDQNFTNPDGIHFDIGYDFITATLNETKLGRR